jgi:alanine racemase
MAESNISSPIEFRPTYIEVDLNALENNFKVISNTVSPSKVMPMIKANAYGHGLIECGKVFERVGAFYLGVAFVEEGVMLRLAGIETPILVFGGVVLSQLEHYLKYNLEINASSISKLQAIDAVAAGFGKKARVQLEVDTGMERVGVHYYNSHDFIAQACALKNIEIVGVHSHFATIKTGDLSYPREQISRFQYALEGFDKLKIKRPLTHISSSGALGRLPEAYFDIVRPGVESYGISPGKDAPMITGLRPVMSLKSQVVYFKVVKKGAGVSYGHTWIAPRDTRIVTIPIGYGDGYMRRLSNKGTVLIRGKRYPIAGTICMDQLMVDIGDGEAYNDDEVVLLGSQGEETISANEIAELVETTPHEVTVALNSRVPRRYITKNV